MEELLKSQRSSGGTVDILEEVQRFRRTSPCPPVVVVVVLLGGGGGAQNAQRNTMYWPSFFWLRVQGLRGVGSLSCCPVVVLQMYCCFLLRFEQGVAG